MEFNKTVSNSIYQVEQDITGHDDQARMAMKKDIRLEETLLSLLSKNECIFVKLTDEKINKNPVISLKYLSELVNEIVLFASNSLNINTSVLKELLANESKTNPNVKLIHFDKNKLSFDTLINLFKGWTSHPSDRQPIFEEISCSVVNIVRYYFLLFESSFRSDLMKRQWSETNKIHLDELVMCLKQIKF